MSKCTITACTSDAVAKGLCAKHYMRQRRRGDPEAAYPPGRQPKPRPEAPEAAALKREVLALREEVATLTRQLDEALARAAAAPGGKGTRALLDDIKRSPRVIAQPFE
jgi:hypothetical protein